MAVEVMLMADVKDLGIQGDTVQVADGFARNYLIPKSLAAPVTEATRRRLEKLRRELEKTREAEVVAAQAVAAKLVGASYTIPVKVGEEGKLFGSVTTSDIADAAAAQGAEIDRHKIELDEPIRELGVYDIKIKIHADVDATIKVWVVEE
jgi:large subunit ribosomal protein L9